ncbi:MAG: potassium channel family protein [Negativicutes bacterium]
MKYVVEIKNTPFHKDWEGKTINRDQTAIVTFIDEDGKEVRTEEYGVVDASEVQKAVEAGEAIDLDWCFVKNLDLGSCFLTSFSAQFAFFHGNVLFWDATFSGEASFNSTTFNDEAFFNKSTFRGKANFNSATFNDEADFNYATFRGKANFNSATFNDEADFNYATFSGNADFDNATFRGNAGFQVAPFSGNAGFLCATFSGNARFWGTTFRGKTGFGAATFGGNAGFLCATFSDETGFDYATFSGNADFDYATFSGNADFDYATFSGKAGFDNATFSDETGFDYATFSMDLNFSDCISSAIISFKYVKFLGYVDMRKLPCDTLTLDSCNIEKTFDLRDAVIAKLSLKDVHNLGPIYVGFLQDNIKNAILSYTDGKNRVTHKDCAAQFQLLKENFRTLGQYDDEDAAYLAYRRELAQYERYEKNETINGKQKIRGWLKWVCLDWVGEYGTNPYRILLSLGVNILIFGCLYALLDFLAWPALSYSGKIAQPLYYFYYSAITAFTVGYGDLSPNSNIVAIFACIESFIGVFLMSYFVVAFSRKVIR